MGKFEKSCTYEFLVFGKALRKVVARIFDCAAANVESNPSSTTPIPTHAANSPTSCAAFALGQPSSKKQKLDLSVSESSSEVSCKSSTLNISPSLATVRTMCHEFIQGCLSNITTSQPTSATAEALTEAVWSVLEESSSPHISSSSVSTFFGKSEILQTDRLRLGWCGFLSQTLKEYHPELMLDHQHHTLFFCDTQGSTVWTWHLWGNSSF